MSEIFVVCDSVSSTMAAATAVAVAAVALAIGRCRHGMWMRPSHCACDETGTCPCSLSLLPILFFFHCVIHILTYLLCLLLRLSCLLVYWCRDTSEAVQWLLTAFPSSSSLSSSSSPSPSPSSSASALSPAPYCQPNDLTYSMLLTAAAADKQSWEVVFYILAEMRLRDIALSRRSLETLINHCADDPTVRIWLISYVYNHFQWLIPIHNDYF